jgi:predicted ATPase
MAGNSWWDEMLRKICHDSSVSIAFRAPPAEAAQRFPFAVPAIAALSNTRLALTTPVTLLVGKNGSGKSTLMEAMVVVIGSITVGTEDVSRDVTLDAVRLLADTLKLTWNVKRLRGFFLCAELLASARRSAV